LASYLGKVKAFRRTTRAEFSAEESVHDLADRRLGVPETYRDAFFILADAGELPRLVRRRAAA